MATEMTRDDGKAFAERWKLINDAEIEELRRTPIEVKFQQLAALMASARTLGWQTTDEAEVNRVRERWCRLRRMLRG